MLFGVADLLFAGIYLSLIIWVVPSRSNVITSIILGLCALFAAGGVGMLWRSRWGHLLAAASCLVMLFACFVLIALILASMAYLHGIYDGVGQAGVAIGAIVILLSIEVVGLLPALQLAHLRRYPIPAHPERPEGARGPGIPAHPERPEGARGTGIPPRTDA